MKSVVAECGQITLSKALRDKSGIRHGSEPEFTAPDGTLDARKAETDPVSRVLACLGAPVDPDKYIKSIRGAVTK